jgi:hypothetical protein
MIDIKNFNLISEFIAKLNLDLKGMTVLTEAGSGSFLYSGLISAMAGADAVYILCENSIYGSFEDIKTEFDKRVVSWNIKTKNVKFFRDKSSLPDEIDLVLNLGFVRPIDLNLISHCSKKSVISYMCEKWEYRQEDLDLELCFRFGIPVAGVNESFENFNIFSSCGQLALKILFEAGCEVAGCKIGILSSDAFGKVIHETLLNNNALSYLFLDKEDLLNFDISNIDILLIAEYSDCENILEGVSSDYIAIKNPSIKIVSFAGAFPVDEYLSKNISCYPSFSLEPRRMFKTLGYLGTRPVIGLHTLGTKVGELLFKKKNYDQDYGYYKNLVQQF